MSCMIYIYFLRLSRDMQSVLNQCPVALFAAVIHLNGPGKKGFKRTRFWAVIGRFQPILFVLLKGSLITCKK